MPTKLLLALLLLSTSVHARAPKWLRDVAPGAAVPAARLPKTLHTRLTEALADAEHPQRTLERLWPVARPRRGRGRIVLLDAREGDKGALLVATISKRAITLTEPMAVRYPNKHEVQARPPFTLDADRRPDLVVPWRVEHRGLSRWGIWVARTDPPGVASIELGTTFRGNGTEVKLACFAALTKTRSRFLVIHRMVSGQDELEIQQLNPEGGWSPAQSLVAGVLGQGLDLPAAYARWVKSFPNRRRKRTRRRGRKKRREVPQETFEEAAQMTLVACPREGLLLPSRLMSTMPGWTVLGPIGRSEGEVRARLKALKGAPRAALIIGLGQAG